MKIKEIQKIANDELKNIKEVNLKTRILISKVLNIPKEFLLAHSEDEISDNQKEEILEGIKKINDNIPIQYIVNEQEFMGLNFFVDENVLIPQPDTEILVEQIINNHRDSKIKILDLCTGSGCIAISLKHYLPKAEVWALDISEKALNIAKNNAKQNNTEINFIKSDLFQNIQDKFDIIVSNPPYIKTDIIKTLDNEVQNEPIIALDGGDDGLDFYKKILKKAYNYLKDEGKLYLEIGYDQKEDLINLYKNDKRYKNIECIKDLANNDRVIIIEK